MQEYTFLEWHVHMFFLTHNDPIAESQIMPCTFGTNKEYELCTRSNTEVAGVGLDWTAKQWKYCG